MKSWHDLIWFDVIWHDIICNNVICHCEHVVLHRFNKEQFILNTTLLGVAFIWFTIFFTGGGDKNMCSTLIALITHKQTTWQTCQMVCKFKFIRYGHRKKTVALHMPRINFGGPPKSKMSHFQISNRLNSS